MIQVKSLRKEFGSYRAVDDISFEARQGEVLGFLGPNGAGKSTTMKMLTCFLRPTSGTAEVCGFDILKDPLAVKRKIGYLPESAPSYPEMLVEEFLRFIGEARGYHGQSLRRQVERVIELAALGEVRCQMIDTLSKGYRQRACLAQALLHEPPVLILDEPTDGLDPNQKHEVRNLIKRLSAERAVLVSTHILEEVDAVCSRALIIARGKLVADGTPEQLVAQARSHNAVSVGLSQAEAERVLPVLRTLAAVAEVSAAPDGEGGTTVRVFAQGGQAIRASVERCLQEQGSRPSRLSVERGRLDEVFRHLTLNPATG